LFFCFVSICFVCFHFSKFPRFNFVPFAFCFPNSFPWFLSIQLCHNSGQSSSGNQSHQISLSPSLSLSTHTYTLTNTHTHIQQYVLLVLAPLYQYLPKSLFRLVLDLVLAKCTSTYQRVSNCKCWVPTTKTIEEYLPTGARFSTC